MYWKFIRIYRVKAESKKEALSKIVDAIRSGKEDQYFQVEFIKPDQEGGWLRTLKSQLLGK